MLSLPHGYRPNAVCIDSRQQDADWLPSTIGCLLEKEVFIKIKLFSLARRRNKLVNSSNTKPLWLKFIVPKEALAHWSFQILKTGKAAKLNRKEGKNFKKGIPLSNMDRLSSKQESIQVIIEPACSTFMFYFIINFLVCLLVLFCYAFNFTPTEFEAEIKGSEDQNSRAEVLMNTSLATRKYKANKML